MAAGGPGIVWLGLLWACIAGAALPVRWPTPDTRFWEDHAGPEAWAQPTASGRLESALFGPTRNGGYRFHEGLDIAPALKRDRRGEATDPIFAAMPGRVMLINAVAGNSSYGRYIVLRHRWDDFELYTLYAHLATIADDLHEGDVVDAGDSLGVMGRSASYGIPRSRAHLHFEVGFIKSRAFDAWYDRQPYGSPNRFGNANGINLVGMDPLAWLTAARDGRLGDFRAYLRSLPTAFRLRISTPEVPDLLQRSPGLIDGELPAGGLVGWLVDFTYYGLPKRWKPLTAANAPAAHSGDVVLEKAYPERFPPRLRRTLTFASDGTPKMADTLRNDLQLIFGFR